MNEFEIKQIRYLKEACGISYKHIAELIGINYSTLRSILSQERIGSIESRRKIQDFLVNVDVDNISKELSTN